jgi:uncharacterized membrane protein
MTPGERSTAGPVHWTLLALVVVLGAGLRLWELDHKPVWSDELVTWRLAGGHAVEELTSGRPVPADAALELLDPVPAPCSRIRELLARESTHPPLFFCLMNPWLNAYPGDARDLDARLRWLRLPAALFGVIVILAVYSLGRVAASAPAGLLAAALAAVSPYAVYLSQEARHYSLPMVLSAAGFALVIMLVRGWRSGTVVAPRAWLAWCLVSLVGLYTHYLMGPVVLAQGLVLAASWWRWAPRSVAGAGAPLMALALVAGGYLPWLATQAGHLGRPETSWMALDVGWPDLLVPLPRFIAGWITMLVALPLESPLRWIQIASGIAILAFAAWLLAVLVPAWRQPAGGAPTREGQRLLTGLLLALLAANLTLIYGLGKDLSLAPRYAFPFHPIIVVLVAIGLCSRVATGTGRSTRLLVPAVLLAGLIGSTVTVKDLIFRKPFDPARVAESLASGAGTPRLLVMGYDQRLQQWALVMSYLLALERIDPDVRANTWVSLVPMEALDGPLDGTGLPAATPIDLHLMAPGAGPGDRPGLKLLVARPLEAGAATPSVRRCVASPPTDGRVALRYRRYRCEGEQDLPYLRRK